MLGGMLFSLLQGSQFDADAKQWRFFADISNNVGLGLELAAPLFPGYFLVFVCAGSVCRALTGAAAGATRASMTSHFARAGNAADIAAKEASQETCVTLLGMCVGLALGRLVQVAPYSVWPVFLALTALHVVANAKAVRSLRMTSLNRERTRLLLQHYSRTVRGSSQRFCACAACRHPPELSCRYADEGVPGSSGRDAATSRARTAGEPATWATGMDTRWQMARIADASWDALSPHVMGYAQRACEWVRMLAGRSHAQASVVLGGQLSSDAVRTSPNSALCGGAP